MPLTEYTILNDKKQKTANTFFPISLSHTHAFPAQLIQAKLSEFGEAGCTAICS